ncbi:uncharacterized protein LOC131631277 [Vicia villosa]|uniref:uncharacterized protein LOC131631277 n=1 Tax=Vicia villosa TaxID=3911 RepID=UPI00273C7253|nr:uncharacterized protein LOC131631277 [Vicia villosa]
MSVLVDGSPTKEFLVSRGLRQGDPLSPFLFVLVAEGLAGLVRKSIDIGEFQSFDIRGSCKVELLQFADDTLIVGDGSWKHAWAIKAVLRAFEVVSGLGINYHKSKLIGINFNSFFLEAASHLFSCRREDSNFYFLGIPIGFNPRKESTWNPLVLKMKKRLEGWTNRFLNLGATKVLCVDKSSNFSSTCSYWWKDILKIGGCFLLDPLVENCRFTIHDGFKTPFWEAKWLDNMVLKEFFPDLFKVSCLKNVSVAAMGGWREGRWNWSNLGILNVIVECSGLTEIFCALKDRL